MMKSHAFVRENLTRAMKYNKHTGMCIYQHYWMFRYDFSFYHQINLHGILGKYITTMRVTIIY